METGADQVCRLCPRNCGVDRANARGVCGQPDTMRAARAALHMWEEPCISGSSGSGAVFFSGCQLHCVYCQNDGIANGSVGWTVSGRQLCDLFLRLQEQGANNINLVTPDIYVPQIVPALELARRHGLELPVVYNTSSYVCVDTLKRLEGLVDIYLPDVKYYSPKRSMRYSHAPDYFEAACAAVEEMVRQAGRARFYLRRADGGREDIASEEPFAALEETYAGQGQVLMKQGVIVRHLLLPGGLTDAKNVLKYLFTAYQNTIYYSILSQYTPVNILPQYPELNRTLRRSEYRALVDYAAGLGIENGFIQEGGTAKESFIPQFDGTGLL